MGKKALTLHMDEKIIDDFRNYCSLNALKLSAKVELLLKKEMETAHSNPTLVKLFEDILKKQSLRSAASTKEQEMIPKSNNTAANDNNSNKEIRFKKYDEPAQENQPDNEGKEKNKVPSIDHLRRVKGL